MAVFRPMAPRADRNSGDRLAAQRIVVEQRKADEGNQKQAKQNGECLDQRKRQPEPALSAHRLLSEPACSVVAVSAMDLPEYNRADDTTAGQRGSRSSAAEPAHFEARPGRSDRSAKRGGPKTAPFRNGCREA